MQVKQSNTRVVRWSDGSLSLQVGAELFDISATVDHSALLASSSANPLIPTAHAAELNNFAPQRAHGLTYLTAKHGYNDNLFEAQASVHGTITFRPTTLQSNTHRRLAGSVKGRYVKGRAIKMSAVPDEDPERVKLEREKADADRAKKLKRDAQKAAGGGARRRPNARPGTRFLGSDEDEEDGDTVERYDRREQPRRGAGGPLAQDEASEEDDGFVVASDAESEGQGGGGHRDDEVSGTAVQRSGGRLETKADHVERRGQVEEADERIEREARRRKDRRKEKRDFSDSDVDAASDAEPEPAARRRRVVEDSDEE